MMRGFLAGCRLLLPALGLGGGLLAGTIPEGWAQPVQDAAPAAVNNELTLTVMDLWERVGACGAAPAGGYWIDYAGFERSEVDIGDRQKELIDTKVRAAIGAVLMGAPADRWMPGQMGTPYDPVTRERVQRAARGDATIAAQTLPPDRNRYVLVRALLVPSPDGPKVSLQADLLNGCTGSTEPYLLPEELVGEPYISPEVLFNGAGLVLWQTRPSGSTALVVEAEIDGDGVEPDVWNKYFSDLLAGGLSRAPGYIDREVFISAAPFKDDTARISTSSPDRHWTARVRLWEMEQGYQIFLRVDRDDSPPLVKRGLINAAELPVRAMALLQGSAGGRFPGAMPVRLGLMPLVLQGEMTRGAQPRLLSFSLATESVVELNLRDYSGATPPRLRVRGARGKELAEPASVPGRPGMVRYRLSAGDYAVRITNPGKSGVRFDLAMRAAAGSLAPALPPNGVLLRDFADWAVGTGVERDGTRTCFAFTVADVMEPTNWRDQRPVIWFKVLSAASVRQDDIDVVHDFDHTRFYSPGVAPVAIVTGTGGVRWRLPLSDVGGRFMSVKELPNGALLVSNESLEGLTQGSRLVLTGTTATGRPGRIEYSLRGYQAAINAMLAECGRDELRRRLVRR